MIGGGVVYGIGQQKVDLIFFIVVNGFGVVNCKVKAVGCFVALCSLGLCCSCWGVMYVGLASNIFLFGVG